MAKFRLRSGKYHGFKDGQRHIYQKGEIIDIDPENTKFMMDLLEPIDHIETEEERTAAPRVQLEIVHKGGGKYNVINSVTGKPVNDKLLTKSQAQDLVMREFEVDDAEEVFEEVNEDDRADDQKANSSDMAESNSIPSRRRSKSK